MPIGWVLNSPLPSPIGVRAANFKCNVEECNVVPRAQIRNFRRYRRHVYAGRLTRKQSTFLAFFVAGGPHIRCECIQYTRNIFGAKDSPTCATYALRRTAVDNQDRYPDTAYGVLSKFYMDDYLGSVKNPETALMLNRSLVELLKLGGFNLTKFNRNVPNLSSKLNTRANNSKEIFTAAINPETASHVLGLKWDHVTDTLIVSRGVDRELKDSVTQRSVLSFVSSVFDSMGLVAPYTVRARLLLENIWRLSGQQWNEPQPNELCRRFTECHSGLAVLGQLKIPRCYFDFPVDEVELHMFGDSSLDVFCSVAFLRAQKTPILNVN